MTAAELAKKVLDLESENKALRAVMQDLMARDPKGTAAQLIFESIVNFEIYNLREGRRSLRWIGISHNEYKTCLEAARAHPTCGFVLDGDNLSLHGPGGKVLLHGLACPDGCYFQIREPLVVNNSYKVFAQVRPNYRPQNFGAADPFAAETTLTQVQYELRPLQSIAVDVQE